MTIFSVLTLIGGLALFLFGMNIMSDGLVKVSGSRLDSILARLTSNRFKALLLGTVVTAVIQSSSATTVMVVGFVNSGIMKLTQAVGVIMGANIGTTVTSWLLSLTGINGSGVVLSMFKPSSFSPILAIIGIIMYMTARGNVKRRDISSILLGFAVLMFGMTTMSSAVEPLASNEQFMNILTVFTNPVLGVLLGAGLTAILQSSSASIGILQALCITGAIPYGAAIPIIMGQNIGTCITAQISAIGAGKNAKRAAMIHLYFNVISSIAFLVIFYAVNHFVQFAFLSEPASAAWIAVIHSLFNIAACIAWFPFANFLVRLATLTIPDKKEKEIAREPEKTAEGALSTLDERFLDNPAFAVKISWDVSARMAQLARDTVHEVIRLLKNYTEQQAERVLELEKSVDQYESALGNYLMKISKKELWRRDSRQVSVMLQCTRDFERIADHAANIKYSLDDMREQGLRITKGGMKELMVYAKATEDIIDQMINAFRDNDLTLALEIEPFEEALDGLSAELKQRHVDRLRRGKCSLEAGLILEDTITDFERISHHCGNVGLCMIRISSGEDFDTAFMLDQVIVRNEPWFRDAYNRIKDKYVLPERKEKVQVSEEAPEEDNAVSGPEQPARVEIKQET